MVRRTQGGIDDMNTLLRAAAAFAAIALATPAFAQQTARTDPKVGLGVGLTASTTSPDIGTLLFVPLNVAPNIRIEPFIGWARSDLDPTPPGGGSFGSPPEGAKTSDFTLGIGAFLVQPIASQVQVYAGGRLGSQWQSFSVTGGGKIERRNTLLAVAAGGEYMPVPRVAFGAELQLSYLAIGDTKSTAANGATVEGGGGSANGTQATVFARFYLF
jgi:hypothetical protein